MSIPLPKSLFSFFSSFPLHTYPAVEESHKKTRSHATLWIIPPEDDPNGTLSADLECLKWQAYLALRMVKNIRLRWDVAPEGGVDGRLPCLHLPGGDLLSPSQIPEWVEHLLSIPNDRLGGFKDQTLFDEMKAWISLLETDVHAAVIALTPRTASYISLLRGSLPVNPSAGVLSPCFASYAGLSTLLPLWTADVPINSIQQRFSEALRALSVRLGSDAWFLGSINPTALDALAFAYLHRILSGPETLKNELLKWKNLLDWEKSVRSRVQEAYR